MKGFFLIISFGAHDGFVQKVNSTHLCGFEDDMH